jgi:hypothetical protein
VLGRGVREAKSRLRRMATRSGASSALSPETPPGRSDAAANQIEPVRSPSWLREIRALSSSARGWKVKDPVRQSVVSGVSAVQSCFQGSCACMALTAIRRGVSDRAWNVRV